MRLPGAPNCGRAAARFVATLRDEGSPHLWRNRHVAGRQSDAIEVHYVSLPLDAVVTPVTSPWGEGCPRGLASMGGSAYYIRFTELSRELGGEAAKQLTAAFGGRRIYVRENLPDDHFLIPVLGDALARRFAEYVASGIGGMSVEIPTASTGEFHDYRMRLRDLASNADLTEAQVANAMGVRMRTVRRMRARLRAERNGQKPASHRGSGHLSGA